MRSASEVRAIAVTSEYPSRPAQQQFASGREQHQPLLALSRRFTLECGTAWRLCVNWPTLVLPS